MKERIALASYLAAVVAATSVHHVPFLLILLAAAILLAGRSAVRTGRRALLAIVLFNSVVTLSYTALSLYRGDFSPRYVMLVNLRVFVVTFLTFLTVDRINLFRALSFSPTLSRIVTLAFGQIVTFRRIFEDFRLALRSRTVARLSAGELLRHGGSTGAWFLRKALDNSEEIARAMKSRGFIGD